MTADRLERVALAHLQRHGASRASLRRVLERRIARSCEAHDRDPAELVEPLEALLTKLERLGYLDDRRYGAALVRRGRARGASRRALRARLQQKGLDATLVETLLDADARDGGEAEAAWRYARRRRLGPFRDDADARRDARERDLAALGRRGFDYGTARSVVDGERDEAPEPA